MAEGSQQPAPAGARPSDALLVATMEAKSRLHTTLITATVTLLVGLFGGSLLRGKVTTPDQPTPLPAAAPPPMTTVQKCDQEAVGYYKDAEHDWERVYLGLRHINVMDANYLKAHTAYSKAQENDATNRGWDVKLATCEVGIGRYQAAVARLTSLVDAPVFSALGHGDQGNAIALLSISYRALGKSKEAEGYKDRAAKMKAHFSEWIDFMARRCEVRDQLRKQ